MKKLLLTSAAVLAVFSSAANAADITPYASVKAVMSFTDGKATFTEGDNEKDKLKNFGGDVAVGAKMDAFRAELAYTYLAKDDKTRRDDSEINKSEISGQSFMLNGYYDIDNPTIFKPYVGAGVGMAKMKYKFKDADVVDPTDTETHSFSKNKFAYSLMAGVGAEVTKNITIDVGYRFTDYGSYDKRIEDGKLKFDTKAHQILAGVRYSF